jgi:hypothetical protein
MRLSESGYLIIATSEHPRTPHDRDVPTWRLHDRSDSTNEALLQGSRRHLEFRYGDRALFVQSNLSVVCHPKISGALFAVSCLEVPMLRGASSWQSSNESFPSTGRGLPVHKTPH